MTNTNELSGIEISKKTARLARLELSDAEHEIIAPQLEKILAMFDQLQAIDTEGVEPLANVVGQALPLRADVITDGNCSDKVLSNAPDETQGFYSVSKVVE